MLYTLYNIYLNTIVYVIYIHFLSNWFGKQKAKDQYVVEINVYYMHAKLMYIYI